ncbi:PhzF family phenazine biosynthesis isomerase [Corallococcus sp. RDP092CA]|uniref:PhzF family phenazine biosynthesis isomerase n=1 Tax=Corallococcus sp. RDP092CA TaxID=3109369 RepID=UPI0035AE4414
MTEPRIELVDVFTKTPGRGNRAAVVLDAGGLTTEQMQAIATAAPATETAFGIAPTQQAEHDLEVRYFSKTCELPLCGHATIGFHYVRARRLGLDSQQLRVKTGAGLLPITIERGEDDHRIVMTQGTPRVVGELTLTQRRLLLEALGLGEEHLVAGLPLQGVTTGHAKVLVAINSHAALAGLRPNRELLIALSKELCIGGFFVFTLDRQVPEVLYHGRMFAPATGVDEDPVTGNANGPAGFYLASQGLFPTPREGEARYEALQGEAMGRPGRIQVLLTLAGGKVERVRITGDAVLLDGCTGNRAL